MTPARARSAVLTALFGAVLLVLAGCTGVPSSSAPVTIKPVPVGEASDPPAMSPAPGIAPSELVENFLTANSIEPPARVRPHLPHAGGPQQVERHVRHDHQRRSRGDGQGGQSQVVVRGRIVGLLDGDGIYKPSLGGTGDGGTLTRFSFTVKRVNGQYRIDGLQGGLVPDDRAVPADLPPARAVPSTTSPAAIWCRTCVGAG